jgi:hypothetical protein
MENNPGTDPTPFIIIYNYSYKFPCFCLHFATN